MTALGSTCGTLYSGNARVITYTASGGEGLSFSVPIGAVLANTTYDVFPAPAGVSSIPLLDLPIAGRTTSTFPVSIGGSALLAGDVLKFLLVE